ncbi:DUF4280 domain-containing protein [Aquabacterium sp. CECT 9606]|uniref:DUF4280 domain-containing protein n=1 Tax=Aquabacterium sp. CECT 9606 TaxID=2845822 RepID=UPI001E2A57E3|nr:DUF4280 domain-containing protein [Aquabacterium sp. CECT 9606]CAH0351022.1 hypothetical protein AQB9606_01885 [Aquabacterium sp. CECT 9606]
MPQQTCMGATMKCTFGLAPSTLVPTPKPIMTSHMVAANIMDHVPIMNIPPFGMCNCPGNPMVAAATAAAMGVLTPMPCIPNTPAPWSPGAATVMLQNFPALDNISMLTCVWGGVITFANAGQTTHMIP